MDLTNVKVGDKFLLPCSYGLTPSAYHEVVFCEKVTPTQAIIGGHKYRRRNASPVGHRLYLTPYCLDTYEKGRDFLRREKVRNFNYAKLSHADIALIYSVLEIHESKGDM